MNDWNPHLPAMPVDSDGNVQHWAGYGQVNYETWHNPFYAEMEIDGMTSGRSAKYLNLKDNNGRKYPMFVSDLVKGIKSGTLEIEGGILKGYWTGSKRGANYGIKTVGKP